ncbi:MAG: CpaF family protein [Planctomycetes bacterium]|nr:CpaF family protein [Planctomycetota bacterium]MBI3835562.1 CpaF family protein [Planctomycetota bacterium]
MFGKRATTSAIAQPPVPSKGSAGTSPPPPGAAKPPLPTKAATTAAAKPKVAKEKVEQFNALKMRLHRKLIDKLDLTRMVGDDETLREQVKTLVSQLADEENTLLNFNERQRLINEVLDETFGLGPLEVILADSQISDILVNGPKQVYVERRGKLELTEVEFRDNAHLMHVIDKIVSAVGRRCDETCPLVDARLADGSRVNAVIPPLAIDGASMSIRRFGADPLTWDDYINFKSVTPEIRDFLQACVLAHLNIVVVGGTGSGKTTLLNNLSSFIPDTDRVVTIEDAAELQLRQPHVVRLETRPANIEGKGRITIRDLLINSLRMRPDRIVVGECRGPETLDMLQAMNTGHDGSLTTVHANSTRDAVSRVETMVMMAGFELPVRAIRQQFAAAIHILVQAQRLSGGARKLIGVTEVTGMEGEIITMQDIFVFEQTGVTGKGRAKGQFVSTGIRPSFLERLKTSGCEVDPSIFTRRVLMVDEGE